MTTTTSSSKHARFWSVYHPCVRAQIPFAVVAGILYFLLLPLAHFVGMRSQQVEMLEMGKEEITRYLARHGFLRNGVYLTGTHAGTVLLFVMLLALVLALVQNGYLHSKRKTDFYHSLPLRRTVLLRANFFSAMTIIFLPLLPIYLLTMAAQLIRFGAYLQNPMQYLLFTVTDLLFCLLAAAAVYLFTAAVAVNVGTGFDTFALTGVLGVLPLGLVGIGYLLCDLMIYGSDLDLSVLPLLSPFTFAFGRFIDRDFYRELTTDYSQPFAHLAIWLVVTVGLYTAASACYRRRGSEVAEQAQPGGILQTVAKCFGAFCGGVLFFGLFFRHGLPAWIVAIPAGALLIGVIGEIILSRGVRSLRRNTKWLLLAGAACVVMVVAIRFDITGYTGRVPDPQQVVSIEISYRGRFEHLSFNRWRVPVNTDAIGDLEDPVRYTLLTEPESIALFVKAHEQAVQDRPPQLFGDHDYAQLSRTHPYTRVQVEYRLQNGKTLTRNYRRMAAQALLTLSELEDKRDFIATSHAVFEFGVPGGLQLRNIELFDAMCQQRMSLTLTQEEGERLVEAVQQDILGEPLEQIFEPDAPALGYLSLNYLYANSERRDLPFNMIDGHCYVQIGAGYTRTIALLSELDLMGYFDSAERVEAIDTMVLKPLMFHEAIPNIVYTLVPDSYVHYNAAYYEQEEDVVVGRDPVDIEAVRALARNQLRAGTLSADYSDLVAVAFYSGDERVGLQLVRFSALPANLRAQIERSMDQEDPYPSYIEELAANGEEVSGVSPEPAATTISLY